MIYGFYFRVLKYTNNRSVSILLSKIAYALYVLIFEIKRLFRKREYVSMSKKEALDIVGKIYKKPEVASHADKYNNRCINPQIDLSIIVPIYNYVNLIRENIESVLNQKTKYNYELILVDDGSTDGAREVLLEYKDFPNVNVILQSNQGIAGARNTGINAATGKYIMFIDCDDTIHEDMVESLMDCIINSNCDIVMCAHNLVKEKDGSVFQVIPNIYPQENLFNYKNGDEIMNYAGLPWGKVYKRELWNNVRFLRGYWYEDTIIQWLLFTQCKKFKYLPKVEYEYRWYENNFSRVQGKKKNPKAIDRYWMLLDIIEKYKELGLPRDGMFYTLLLKHLSAHYYNSFVGLDESVIQAMFVLARELVLQYRPKKMNKLPYMLSVTEKAFIRGDVSLWRLSSQYQ